MQATGGVDQPEEFLDLCQKVKKMTEDDRKRKRTHEDSDKSPRPALVYGPIDWRMQPKKKEVEKEVEKEQVEEKEEEVPEEAAQMEEMDGEAPKKKGKIKRRGKKKGKRNKPDREEEKDTNTAMDS